MKTIDEVKAQIKLDIDDSIGRLMIGMCGGFHPLSDFVIECFKPEHIDKVTPLTKENVIEKMQSYIDFALEKAYNQRGISTSRSMWKFKKWLWVLEDPEIDCDEYLDYGISNLEKIAEKYNLVIKYVS